MAWILLGIWDWWEISIVLGDNKDFEPWWQPGKNANEDNVHFMDL